MAQLSGKWKLSRIEFDQGFFIDTRKEDSSHASFMATFSKKKTASEAWTVNDSLETEAMYKEMFNSIKGGFIVFNADSTTSSNLYRPNGQTFQGTYCYDRQCQQLFLKKDGVVLNYHNSKILTLTSTDLVFTFSEKPLDVSRIEYKKE